MTVAVPCPPPRWACLLTDMPTQSGGHGTAQISGKLRVCAHWMGEPMRVQMVVFDMAGTTVYDGDAVRSCFRAALADADLSATPEVINAVMGLPKPEAIRRLAGPGVPAQRIAAIHEDFVARMKRYYDTNSNVREADG